MVSTKHPLAEMVNLVREVAIEDFPSRLRLAIGKPKTVKPGSYNESMKLYTF